MTEPSGFSVTSEVIDPLTGMTGTYVSRRLAGSVHGTPIRGRSMISVTVRYA